LTQSCDTDEDVVNITNAWPGSVMQVLYVASLLRFSRCVRSSPTGVCGGTAAVETKFYSLCRCCIKPTVAVRLPLTFKSSFVSQLRCFFLRRLEASGANQPVTGWAYGHGRL